MSAHAHLPPGASSKPTGSWCLTPILLRFVERLKQVMWCPRGQFCWWLDNSNTSHKLCYLSCVETSFSRRWEAAKKTLSDNGTSNKSNQWNLWIQYNSISYHDSCTHFFSCSDGAQSISNPVVSICDSTSNFFDHSPFLPPAFLWIPRFCLSSFCRLGWLGHCSRTGVTPFRPFRNLPWLE